MRSDLITYWSLPFYRAMIERSGFGDDIARFDEACRRATSSGRRRRSRTGFLDDLTAIGSPEEVRAGIERYAEAGATLAVRRTGPEDGLQSHAGSREPA